MKAFFYHDISTHVFYNLNKVLLIFPLFDTKINWLARNHLASNFIQKSSGILVNPQTVPSMSGIFPADGFKLKFCKRAAMHKNIVFLAKVSPAQSLRPAPKGREASFLTDKFPLKSKYRSGLKLSGSFQSSLSVCKAKRLASAKVFLGMS